MDTELLDLVVQKIKNQSETEFKSGFIDLDEILSNVEKGQIVVIGGRPAMGKTAFALAYCINLLKENKKVLYFSLETTKKGIMKRFLLLKSKIKSEFFIKTKDDFKRIEKAKEFFADKELILEDKCSITTEEIEEIINKNKPDVVFIDYVQIIKMPKAPNLTEATNLAIQELKEIAVRTNTLIFLLSGLSRNVENRYDKHPMLSDLRNGSLLEEISDVVLLLYREDYYDAQSDMKGIGNIIVAKNKNGATGQIILKSEFGIWENINHYDNICVFNKD